ncbi:MULTISPECIES: hypothetical protein [Halobacteriovorax]|uniref:Uncharacterized protein n=2 Tax=Halobacteriovorax TaxID=1652133 RepID=A0ABY0ILV8_9BACT|nr:MULTISPECIES: hypothetical protein [Halobacteriovorax]RZF22509.1 hypothetical protein DAY19_01695 [Halobacteriovorax vibrionivorans]TGD47701.1 hypothetical protein EP118_07060 [Halobacteriovorax sp. Y22]
MKIHYPIKSDLSFFIHFLSLVIRHFPDMQGMTITIVFTLFNLVFLVDYFSEKGQKGKKYRLLSYMFLGVLSLLSIQVFQNAAMPVVFGLLALCSLALTLVNEFINPPKNAKERVYNGCVNMLLPTALLFIALRWFPSASDTSALQGGPDTNRNIFIIQTLLVLGLAFKYAPTLIFTKKASKEINEDLKTIKL